MATSMAAPASASQPAPLSTPGSAPDRRRPGSPPLAAVLALAAVLLALAPVLLAPPARAVANGVPAPAGTLGFAAKFVFTGIPRTDGSTYDSACSGALVAPEWVVTAGHCFHDAARTPVSGPPPYASSTVIVGATTDTDPAAQVRTVVDVRQAPNGADVALARLSEPVQTVRPLALPSRAPRAGQVLGLAGWGATTSVDPTPSSQLMTGLVEVGTVADQTIGVSGYAPAPDTSACPYDSGAPYFRVSRGQLVLVAVESGGPPCPHTDEDTAYRADVLAPWIREQLAAPR
ncbi:trypsin-like serine protease [Quadrisphaera sp. DSM 44207]|uniref:S1 family peptidase n=1 Tax=Quadrisphaera sp. DSM 44207 TaxID=1881057 RepID=UPI000887BACB|nr:trypsin-like serine protease [Quadrisphaera sp. DSM 44207]SDQ06793.1 Trypsin [Quadrisphaera sp. DSM 44207]